MSDIYSRTPINKTAALVTGQNNHEETKFAILSAELENLKMALIATKNSIDAAITKKERRPFGIRQREIQEQIEPIKRESDIQRMQDAGVEVERYEDGVQISVYVHDLYLSKVADLIEQQEHLISK